MDARDPTGDTQALYSSCLALLIEAVGQVPAAGHVSDPGAQSRLDLAIAKLKTASPWDVEDLVFQVLSKEPACAYAHAVWGLALARAGLREKALMAFDTAVDLDRTFLLAICGKVLLLAMCGRGPGLEQEVALLRRQMSLAYNDFAKLFVQVLGSLGAPPARESRYVNIGGGPNYDHWHWRNLDSVRSDSNPDPLRFSPDCAFPLDDASAELVYSSHCLEHLDDPTASRVLTEARRVVREDGALLVKIPDFERIRADWLREDPSLICAPVWNVESLLPMWAARGVADTLDNRAAVIFTSYWNDAYGDENSLFSGEGEGREGAYLGPPVMPAERLRAVAAGASPHGIAATLRQHVIDSETGFHFNHQNAWDRSEFEALLRTHGFAVLSFDAAKIAARYHWVPLIDDMDHMSMYCLAVPAA